MKYILLYLALVGLPLLGLLGILRAGETLEVPAAIGGRWAVAPAPPAGPSCAAPAFAGTHRVLTVSQSGRYVQAWFDDPAQTVLTGRLDGRTLTLHPGRSAAVPAAPGCGEPARRVLRLRLPDADGPAGVLTGWWRVPGCAACPPHPVRAVRLPVHER